MNLLLATVGATWAVVPELLAFTNPQTVPLLAEHPERDALQAVRQRWEIEPVDEVWVVTT